MTDDDREPARSKPTLRGLSHLVAVFGALAGWGVLLNAARCPRAVLAGSIYGASLAMMFGVSALYHLPTWRPGRRRGAGGHRLRPSRVPCR